MCQRPISLAAFTAAQLDHAHVIALADRLAAGGTRVVRATESVMAAMSPARTPSGAIAIAERPGSTPSCIFEPAPSLAVMLIGVQDPGNVGAVLRVAEAAGATGVLVSSDSADPFGWKALRGSMGSAFRLPVSAPSSVAEGIAQARERGVRLIGTAPRARTSVYDADLKRSVAFVIGGEGRGLPAVIESAVDEMIAIPMHSPVESLNVAVATGVVLYEARRQRGR